MPVLDVWLVMLSLLYGFSVLLEVPAVLGVAVHLGKPQAKVRTLAFTNLVVGNVTLVFTNRSWWPCGRLVCQRC